MYIAGLVLELVLHAFTRVGEWVVLRPAKALFQNSLAHSVVLVGVSLVAALVVFGVIAIHF